MIAMYLALKSILFTSGLKNIYRITVTVGMITTMKGIKVISNQEILICIFVSMMNLSKMRFSLRNLLSTLTIIIMGIQLCIMMVSFCLLILDCLISNVFF